jgi:hypothetical protein
VPAIHSHSSCTENPEPRTVSTRTQTSPRTPHDLRFSRTTRQLTDD